MIYILTGNDIKKKGAQMRKLIKDSLPVFLSAKDVTKEIFFDYAKSVSLFSEPISVIVDGMIKEGSVVLSKVDLETMNGSSTVFIFTEDKLPVAETKVFKKDATILDFSVPESKLKERANIFGIADAFSRKDKINTWILFREAVGKAVSPEEVSGIIFWKIKMMLLDGSKVFKQDELKKISSELVSLYHKAHRGEVDFAIGLEQFILSVLSK